MTTSTLADLRDRLYAIPPAMSGDLWEQLERINHAVSYLETALDIAEEAITYAQAQCDVDSGCECYATRFAHRRHID
jgi:hypothetical protein